jgi:hypothetical protein
MRTTDTKGRLGLATAALLALTSLTGCGELTIRTWIKVIESESTGSVRFNLPNARPFVMERIQGGFLATIVMDTTSIPAPIEGDLVIEEIKVAAAEAAPARGLFYICAWRNPNLPSEGAVFLDILGGQGNTQVTTNLRTTSGFAGGGVITDVTAETALTLEGDLLTAFLGAADSGSADGLFATRAPFEGESSIGGVPVIFSLDLGVTNDTTPPVFDEDHLYNCSFYWEPDQGTALYHGVNSKSSYLRAWPGDDPLAPRVISLEQIGAVPGETLRLDTIGEYAELPSLEDGNKRTMTAVFSSTSEIRGTGQRNRIPGAIDAGTDINTGSFLSCFLIFCSVQSSDIAQDFRVDPGASVVVPAGAKYLFVAPLPGSRKWADNSGFGFGVDVDPGPYPYEE